MKHRTVITGLAAVLCLGVGIAMAGPEHDHGTKKADFASVSPKCPVMGGTIDFNVSSETKDGPVYFCCGGCIGRFEASPDKYTKKVATQREALAKLDKVQVKCPVSGKPVDTKVSLEHDGKTIYFFCPDCRDKFKKDPAKYATGLANSYTYQTICPVMGHKINPMSFGVLPTGETIYYCCNGCDSKLLSSPAKYNKKLVAQGININWAKVKEMIKKKGDSKGHDHDDGHGHDHGDHP